MGRGEKVVVFHEEFEAISDVVAVELLDIRRLGVDAYRVHMVELLGHGAGGHWGLWTGGAGGGKGV